MSSPKAPDPTTTAAAQSGLNTDTAETQQLLNMVNQVGPDGSTTYNQTGTTGYTNSNGKYVTLPQYTATTTYSPAQQAIYDKSTQAQSNIADIASQQSQNLENYLNTPFSFNNGNSFSPTASVSQPGQFSYSSQANPGTFSYGSSVPSNFSYTGSDAQNQAYDLASQRILPQQQKATAALQTQLANQGIQPGSAAWNNAITLNNQSNNDQLNQLALNGQQQFYGQALNTAQQNMAAQNQGYNQALGTYGANTQAQLAAQQQNAGQQLSAYQANTNARLAAEQAAYGQGLSTEQQQYQEALGNRNQPINEITALLSGSQVSNPTTGYTATPQTQVGGVDYTGLVNQQYQSQLASSNSMLGGLFGLGGTLGSAGIKQGWFG